MLSPENIERAEAKEIAKSQKPLAERSFLELCRFGFAFTWPILAGLAALIVVLLLRR